MILNYLIAGCVGGLVMYLVTGIAFMILIKSNSRDMKPYQIGKTSYFFMTQDQIQNACKAIIKTEFATDRLKKHSDKIEKEHGWGK